VNFEEYLISKKIDSKAFAEAEPQLWNAWKMEFEQMHVNSFTVQKLNLINPIRRKYTLPLQEVSDKPSTASATTAAPATPNKPVTRPKPKLS
jgi:hypothetical protein